MYTYYLFVYPRQNTIKNFLKKNKKRERNLVAWMFQFMIISGICYENSCIDYHCGCKMPAIQFYSSQHGVPNHNFVGQTFLIKMNCLFSLVTSIGVIKASRSNTSLLGEFWCYFIFAPTWGESSGEGLVDQIPWSYLLIIQQCR